MTEFKNLFVGSGGDLVRTDGDWPVVREKYVYHFNQIDTNHQLKATLRAGPYAWPGGYPLYFHTSDGAALCFKCCREEFRLVTDSVQKRLNDGWQVVGCQINEEDADLTCDHCNEKIESAYGEDDEN